MVGLKDLLLTDGLKDIILATVPVLSLIVTILALTLGHRRSLSIAQMQIESSARLNRNDIISPMRQAWIDTLRTKLSEFLSLSSIYHRFLSSDENILQFQKEHNIQPVPPDIERKLFILYLNIVLMLNDNESDHNRLIDLLGNFRVDLFDDDVPSEDKRKSYQEIIRLSKSILKREWERVKKDE